MGNYFRLKTKGQNKNMNILKEYRDTQQKINDYIEERILKGEFQAKGLQTKQSTSL